MRPRVSTCQFSLEADPLVVYLCLSSKSAIESIICFSALLRKFVLWSGGCLKMLFHNHAPVRDTLSGQKRNRKPSRPRSRMTGFRKMPSFLTFAKPEKKKIFLKIPLLHRVIRSFQHPPPYPFPGPWCEHSCFPYPLDRSTRELQRDSAW